ncbi:hypothetical protein WJX79_008283 [Trebouxia sp. C0005]
MPHKVNHTGKLERTYTTRHAQAEQDPFAALANLLAHEMSRSYALHHSEAYINIQAVLAGFNKDSWKQNHHLGRAAVVVNESWYYALLPGLFATAELSDLSVRRQELKNTLLNLVEAYWQALPIKVLKCDLNVVADDARSALSCRVAAS